MISEAVFKIKNSIKGWSDQTISFSTRDIKSALIQIKDTQCILRIDGNSEDENLKNIITIWETIIGRTLAMIPDSSFEDGLT